MIDDEFGDDTSQHLGDYKHPRTGKPEKTTTTTVTRMKWNNKGVTVLMFQRHPWGIHLGKLGVLHPRNHEIP